jgi:hypothetical protein
LMTNHLFHPRSLTLFVVRGRYNFISSTLYLTNVVE